MKLNVLIFGNGTSSLPGIDPRLGTGMSGGVVVGKNKTPGQPGAAIENITPHQFINHIYICIYIYIYLHMIVTPQQEQKSKFVAKTVRHY